MKKLNTWFSRIIFRSRIHMVLVSEFPEKLKNKTVYVEGDNFSNEFWYAKMICPCGCGDTLTLNLFDDVSPSWRIIQKKNSSKFSIYPSIRRKSKCRSHFWIIDSEVR